MRRHALALLGVCVLWSAAGACNLSDEATPPKPKPTLPDMRVADMRAGDMKASDLGPDLRDPVEMGPPQDMPPDQDMAPDMEVEEPLLDPCAPDAKPRKLEVVAPFGETFFVQGDEYLAFWGPGLSCAVKLESGPGRATILDDERLTPDRAGDWVLVRGADRVTLKITADYLNADTFLNYNYSPTAPLLLQDTVLWVAAPTSSLVQRVKLLANGPELSEPIPTGSWPTALALWKNKDTVLVSQTGRDTLGFLNPDSMRLEDAIRVGDEPASIVVVEDTAYVALGGEDAVVKVDLLSRKVVDRIEVGRDPRAMVYDESRKLLFVASLISLNATPYGKLPNPPALREQEQRDIAVIATSDFKLVGFVPEVGTILRGLALSEDNKSLVVTLSHAINDQSGVEADSKPHRHGLAQVMIEDGVSPDKWGVKQISLDDQLGKPAPSPHTIVKLQGGYALTLSAGRKLLSLDEAFKVNAQIDTGHDPRGLVLSGTRLYTYAWLDNKLESWDAFSLAQDSDGRYKAVEIGQDPTPPQIKAGQRIFNDATFSKNGDFSCNNCHIDGLTDGLVWNILLDGDVNTLSFRNVGGTGPFLWGGFLPTLFDFSREVLRLVGANATGLQMEQLTLYMQSVTAPPNPYSLPGGRHTEAGLKGRELFNNEAGCTACHSGPLFTNLQTVAGKTPDLQTDTPALIATYDSGPWGRQAQWRTLEEMTRFAAQFTKSSLNDVQLEQLTQYVRELPGDLLYLNSATPLNDSRYVWTQSPVELSFSSLLAPNQSSLFKLESKDSAGAWVEVPATWTLAGRFARAQLRDGLASSTQYRVRVDAGLKGALGYRTRQAVTVSFETGQPPGTDISGTWEWTISGAVNGTLKIAFLQGRGGQVSGTILESDGGIDFDFVEGFVSGTTLVIEPFIALTDFGDVQVTKVQMELQDLMGADGYADDGTGTVETSLVNLNVRAKRLTIPGQ